jgi:hypothetical protein
MSSNSSNSSGSSGNLETALAMALQLGQLQAGFLGQTAHELRSPMSQMMSLQQLIMADLCEDPAEEREFIAQCYAACQKFMTLLDLVVDVSKLDYGAAILKADSFDYAVLIMELESIFVVKAQNRNLKLKFSGAEAGTAILMTGDRLRLQQYFLTLLNTTINHTLNGEIRVDYGVIPGDRLQFQVTSRSDRDFWQEATIPDIKISSKPTPEEIKQAAQKFEFSPALKWQLCEKLIAVLGGQASKQITADGVIQVQGWLPLVDKK